MSEYTKNAPTALGIALVAVLYEADLLGIDINQVCLAATTGMVDGAKPYRSGSANWVVPTTEAIEDALATVHASRPRQPS